MDNEVQSIISLFCRPTVIPKDIPKKKFKCFVARTLYQFTITLQIEIGLQIATWKYDHLLDFLHSNGLHYALPFANGFYSPSASSGEWLKGTKKIDHNGRIAKDKWGLF